MAKLDDDKFDPFADTTPPRADGAGNGQAREEKPAETPPDTTETERPAKPTRARQRAETTPQQPAEIDKATRNRWRTILQNSARKLAADRARLNESEEAWAATVTEARAIGVPANVILAAAADADIEVPE